MMAESGVQNDTVQARAGSCRAALQGLGNLRSLRNFKRNLRAGCKSEASASWHWLFRKFDNFQLNESFEFKV